MRACTGSGACRVDGKEETAAAWMREEDDGLLARDGAAGDGFAEAMLLGVTTGLKTISPFGRELDRLLGPTIVPRVRAGIDATANRHE